MSFQQGLSGLNASSKQLDVIGNNVANSSTVGFKQAQAQFADSYAAAISGAPLAGTGTKVATIVQQFTQGNITNTSNPMDTAISGKGFFRVIDQSGAVLYSRNGQLQVDKNGFIVNNQGHKVSGYLPNASGLIVAAAPVPLQISAADLVPKQSANVVVGANLDALSTVPLTAVFNPNDPNSYSNSTSMTVYDSLGASHVGSLYFQRQPISPTTGAMTAASTTLTVASVAGLSVGNTVTVAGAGTPDLNTTITAINGNVLTLSSPAAATVAGAAITSNAGSVNWNTYLTIDGASVPTLPGNLTTLTFNALGQLISPVGQIASAGFTPNGAATQTLKFDFGQTSQYGGKFGVNTLTQDGYASGRLSDFITSPDGVILGHYSNGQSRPLGQMVLANFTDPQGLQPMGNNEWVESSASGGPLVGVPGSSSLGVLQTSAVEDSNVDLTAELVNMITAQRAYQANAQGIKAQDQILQTLMNLR